MLIGVTGYAEHGKDATGRFLGYKRFAFADQLKELALRLNPYVDSKYTLRLYQLVQDQGWDEAKKVSEVRRFLQHLGTDVRDMLGEDVWVQALEKKIRQDPDVEWRMWLEANPLGDHTVPTTDIVVTDVRFPNEADWVHHMRGELWRVTRLNADGTVYDNGIGTEHPSEAFVAELPADREIEAYTLGDLEREVRALVSA